MTRQEYFEHFYADQHDIPAESLQQYRWVDQDGYRLPGISAAYRNFCAGADSRQPEVDRIFRESRNDAVAYKALAERQEELRAELDLLKSENEALRNGMKGDYSIDAWLEFVAEEEQLRKDAERYRWLRNAENDVALMFGGHAWEDMSHEYMDQAIDETMAKEGEH